MSKTIYIAGGMRGYKFFNFPAFDAAKEQLLKEGWNVISPADIDRERGFGEESWPTDPEYDWDDLSKVRGFNLREVAKVDLLALCECDAIYMLRNWYMSKGAMAEWSVARWIGLEIIYEVNNA